MTIKAALTSKSLYLYLGSIAACLLLMIVLVNILLSEVYSVKERYCDVSPDSTLCQMYPNINEAP